MNDDNLDSLSVEELDELVHDRKGDEAAQINNQGKEAQLAYLRGGEEPQPVPLCERCRKDWNKCTCEDLGWKGPVPKFTPTVGTVIDVIHEGEIHQAMVKSVDGDWIEVELAYSGIELELKARPHTFYVVDI